MRGHPFLTALSMAAILLAGTASPALAQMPAPDSRPAWEQLLDMDDGKIAVIMIFGTGMLAVLGVAVTGIIRAVKANSNDPAELHDRLAHLEQRVASLEQQIPRL